jgi:uncharacterized membrane protein
MTTILRPSSNPKAVPLFVALILGAVGSIPLVFLTPPFQVPDEVQHFYRAYQLSEFRIRAEVQNGVAGGTLPESLPQLVQSSVYTSDGVVYPAMPTPISGTLKLRAIPLDSSKSRFIAFPGSAFYSPLPYLPQVLGISVGRLMGLGPLYLLYLGRLFNCLAALALVGLAVNSMPFAEELVLIVGLLPMSMFLYASLSADAAVISCALVFTALSLSASTRGNWITWELVIATAAAAVLCSLKPVYAPTLLAGMVPGLFQPGKARRVIRSHSILLGVALGVTAGWMLLARSTMTTLLGGGHPTVQINVVLHHPMILVHAVAHSLTFGQILYRYTETVGRFGWLTVPLRPGVVCLLPLASLVIACTIGNRSPRGRTVLPALWHVVLALASAALVMTAMYLMSSNIGQDEVTGVQGRYFIPILVLAGLAAIELAPGIRRSVPRWQSLACIAVIIFVEIVAMDSTIIRAFDVFSTQFSRQL